MTPEEILYAPIREHVPYKGRMYYDSASFYCPYMPVVMVSPPDAIADLKYFTSKMLTSLRVPYELFLGPVTT